MQADYSIWTVITFEFILAVVVAWGVIFFPLLCRQHVRLRNIGDCQRKRLEKYAASFFRLSMWAAAIIGVSFVLN